ncbi:MAG: branched-chain amino acid ABC transporter substrate-binding protein [Chloroflexota bacterium]
MKKSFLHLIGLLMVASLLAGACSAPAECSDPLGCVSVGSGENIKIAVLVTLSGPDSPYGIDALRGVEIAVAEKQKILGHPIELVQVDDKCTPLGGYEGAEQIAADPSIVGVIGATCSGATAAAAPALSQVGLTTISPSSTAPSLTAEEEHQAGFFRTIYNDKAQGKAVAQFVFEVLGMRTMSTIHDGQPYAMQLQAAACENFEKLGGDCLGRFEIETGSDISAKMFWLSKLKTEILYFPVYSVDGHAILEKVAEYKISSALISSDGLLGTDFIQQNQEMTRGMYLSGPKDLESPDFEKQYVSRYGEAPIASFHLQAYDAANLLFAAIEKAAASRAGALSIPRQALRNEVAATRGMNGLSGILTCSPLGDCAEALITIYQVRDAAFHPIYP